MQPYIHQNPPSWAIKVLKIFWTTLKRHAYKGALPKAPDAEEYGCGFFGCVFPTNKQGVTFKLTKDRNEARLVYWLIKHKQPPGILRHYKILKLDVSPNTLDQHVLTRDVDDPPCKCLQCAGYPIREAVWAIWREEVREAPGKPAWLGYPIKKFIKNGMATLYDASKAVFWFARDGRYTSKVVAAARRMVASGKLKGNTPVTALAAVELALKKVAKTELRQVAQSVLSIYQKHNILITDIHANNLGKTKRGWVITDPGEVVWLPKAKIRRARR